MNLASTKQLDNPVANLLQSERLFDYASVISRHGNRVLVSEKIRGVQHVDMQSMTLDPLATVKETTQQANGRLDPNSQRPLDCVHSAHLVSDRADATDPGSDVGSFGVVTTAKE